MSFGPLPRGGAPEDKILVGELAPMACPFCHDKRVTTTSKSIGDETYWRCQACGDIWNQSRLKAAKRYW